MRVVDTLISVGERCAVVTSDVTKASVFVDGDGWLHSTAYLEIIAQSIAAMNGFKTHHLNENGHGGFLLGAKKLKLSGRARVGDMLTTSVYKVAKFEDFGIIQGTVRCGDEVLAEGEIKVWTQTGEGVTSK